MMLSKKKLAAVLASIREAICVQLQGDYFVNREDYEIFISEICFNEIEKETPEVISILSYFVCQQQEIPFNQTDRQNHLVKPFSPNFLPPLMRIFGMGAEKISEHKTSHPNNTNKKKQQKLQEEQRQP